MPPICSTTHYVVASVPHVMVAGALLYPLIFIVAIMLLFAAIGYRHWQRARRIALMRQREIERNTPRRLRRKL